MATGQTIKTQGMQLTVADALNAQTKISGLNNLSGLSAAVNKIALDDFDNLIMSSRPGRRKAGELSIDGLLSLEDPGQLLLWAYRDAGVDTEFRIVFLEGTLDTISFRARVTNITINGTDDDVYKFSATLAVTTKPVRT